MTLAGKHWEPPTFAELRARAKGRTGAELIYRLRENGFAVPWDATAKVFRVRDKAGIEILVIPTQNTLPDGFLIPALDLLEGAAG